MDSGIFYRRIDGTCVDVWQLSYNPDATNKIDVEILIDDTAYSKDFCYTFLSGLEMFNPIEGVETSLEVNQDLFLSTLAKFYSTMKRGLRYKEGNNSDN